MATREITVIRRGTVLYLAGYCQDSRRPGAQPVYREARVEQLSDGSVMYYPPTALACTTDGGCTLPADLADKVTWDR